MSYASSQVSYSCSHVSYASSHLNYASPHGSYASHCLSYAFSSTSYAFPHVKYAFSQVLGLSYVSPSGCINLYKIFTPMKGRFHIYCTTKKLDLIVLNFGSELVPLKQADGFV